LHYSSRLAYKATSDLAAGELFLRRGALGFVVNIGGGKSAGVHLNGESPREVQPPFLMSGLHSGEYWSLGDSWVTTPPLRNTRVTKERLSCSSEAFAENPWR
jgi:hypothetical protein